MINGLKSNDHESKNTSIKLSEKVNNFEITIADLKE
jgi:centrosomal protein CEP135